MTPADLLAALSILGWSQRHLASRLGCPDDVINRWANGRAPVPEPVAGWLNEVRRAVVGLPAPVGWRNGG